MKWFLIFWVATGSFSVTTGYPTEAMCKSELTRLSPMYEGKPECVRLEVRCDMDAPMIPEECVGSGP